VSIFRLALARHLTAPGAGLLTGISWDGRSGLWRGRYYGVRWGHESAGASGATELYLVFRFPAVSSCCSWALCQVESGLYSFMAFSRNRGLENPVPRPQMFILELLETFISVHSYPFGKPVIEETWAAGMRGGYDFRPPRRAPKNGTRCRLQAVLYASSYQFSSSGHRRPGLCTQNLGIQRAKRSVVSNRNPRRRHRGRRLSPQ